MGGEKVQPTPETTPVRPEDEKLGLFANLAYGIQHILTMYGGIVAVPLIVGQAAGLSPADIGLLVTASLFAGGVATILQTIGLPFFGCQLPLVQGVSFAGVATMITISGNGGIQAVFGAVIAASLIGLLITPIFARVTKFFPPLVAGIVITLVVANLLLGGVQNSFLRIAAVIVIALIVGAIVNRVIPSGPSRSPERRR